VIRRYSSADHPAITDPSSVDLAPQWIPQPVLPSADPGAHRFVWDFHTKRDDGPLAPPATYRVRLSVDGKTYTRPAVLRRDPRIHATNADLEAQYDLANAIENQLSLIDTARTHAEALLESKKLSASQAQYVRQSLLGVSHDEDPDQGGATPSDFTTLHYLANSLQNLEMAVESADAAPTSDMRKGYAVLTQTLHTTLTKLSTLPSGV
jgi:hypothetical protein